MFHKIPLCIHLSERPVLLKSMTYWKICNKLCNMWFALGKAHFRSPKIEILSVNLCKNLIPLVELRSVYYNLSFYLALDVELYGGMSPPHCAVCCIQSRAWHLARRYNRFSTVVTVSPWNLFWLPSWVGSTKSQTNFIQNQCTNVNMTCFYRLLAHYMELR